MTALILRGDALNLPLADNTVDLICTSPPYFALRSYTDNGQHYDGQLGSEPTPAEYIDALIAATREMVRVLKPSGSIWLNLGDKYAGSAPGALGVSGSKTAYARDGYRSSTGLGVPTKSLIGLPWRYALRCIDDLGLILRAEVIWAKPNGLPESVTDRVRRSHEQWFHFTHEPRYYSAVDEIREPLSDTSDHAMSRRERTDRRMDLAHSARTSAANPLGKLPGSVWSIATQPLTVPAHLGVDHFAAFPMEWPRRLILGWSPPGICTVCGEGRQPVSHQTKDVFHGAGNFRSGAQQVKDGSAVVGWKHDEKWRTTTTITGYVCACTPYTDHPGSGDSSGPDHRDRETGVNPNPGGGYQNRPNVGPRREYHDWTPAPTRPAVVLDPFMGTGTTLLVAEALGRTGVGVDLSWDYCSLAAWRTSDPAQRAAAMQVDKPAPVIVGQGDLFEGAG